MHSPGANGFHFAPVVYLDLDGLLYSFSEKAASCSGIGGRKYDANPFRHRQERAAASDRNFFAWLRVLFEIRTQMRSEKPSGSGA